MPTVKRTEVSLSCVQCSLYLISSSINVSFIARGWTLSGQTLYTRNRELAMTDDIY